MIRKTDLGNGIVIDEYICHECKTSEPAAAYGVQRDDAINSVPPHGWLREIVRDMRNRPLALDYCPRCAVAPEYRKQDY
jgi:hypothetical protein